MKIDKNVIEKLIFKLDCETLRDKNFGVRAIHIYDLKEILDPLSKNILKV